MLIGLNGSGRSAPLQDERWTFFQNIDDPAAHALIGQWLTQQMAKRIRRDLRYGVHVVIKAAGRMDSYSKALPAQSNQSPE